MTGKLVKIDTGSAVLEGDLNVPEEAAGVVLFAHGSGSGRHSPRNNYVAEQLRMANIGTLLFDLLTEDEDLVDRQTAALRFNIDLLTNRLVGTTRWLCRQKMPGSLPIGYFGASTGAAAALKAAAGDEVDVAAIVSRGGRPDLAMDDLDRVTAPVLLIVGGLDEQVLEMNNAAMRALASDKKELSIVAGATHLFEEPGKLEEVSKRAGSWFVECFTG